MTIAAGGKIQHHTRFQTKAIRWGLTWAAIIIAAQQPGYGEEIYRWTDAEGRVHFSDVPPSAGDHAPLRALEPAPAGASTSRIPEDHYSVLNQAKRLEINRLEREQMRAAPINGRDRAGDRVVRARRQGRSASGGYADDLDPLADGVYSTLGPRTDLTKFPPPGHPVYSPTLGFPPNDYYHRYKARRYPNTRLSLPLRAFRRGAVHHHR